jgi:hypothetical protein
MAAVKGEVMKTCTKTALLALAVSSCTQKSNEMDMQGALDRIRELVAQSSLIAVEAACAENPARAELITASVVLLRRATAGPEMNRMMGGDMNMDQPGVAAGRPAPSSAQTSGQVAIHAASAALFEVLESLSLPTAPSCDQMRPVALAASGALLRRPPERGADEVTRKLDQDMSQTATRLGGLTKGLDGKTPAAVRNLVEGLEKS